MHSRKFQTEWLRKIINGVLIFFIVALSLAYFDGFIQDHDHAFHLSILVDPSSFDHHSLPPPKAFFPQRQVNQYKSLAHHFIAVKYFTSNLAQLYNSRLGFHQPTVNTAVELNFLVIGQISITLLVEKSVWLPPPEKPPSIHLSIA